jgi:CubicO group peptidase (beta-lactamase class C family)
MEALDLPGTWPVPAVAAGVVRAANASGGSTTATTGDPERRWALASVTKLLTTMAVLVAVEEGTVGLDEEVGPPGSTLRHLLAHTSGLSFDGQTPIARPGTRRIYSNTGIEAAAAHVEARSRMPFAAYAREAVLQPLDLAHTDLDGGSPAAGAHASLADLLAFAAELLAPTLVAPPTLAEATSVQFPGLPGVVPGIGRMDPCDWGLGFELRDAKSPHWTGTANSATTFGHFGGSGTFLWVDPEARVACVALTDRAFDRWALDAWPAFSDAVLADMSSG